MKNQERFTISNLTLEQLNIIKDALDTYCRIGLLQFENIVPKDITWNKDFSYGENHQSINLHFAQIRSLIVKDNPNFQNMPNNQQWSMGIGQDGVPRSANMSCEMYQNIRDFITIRSGGNPRGTLDLTENEDIVVEDMNLRLEKMLKIINKIKK